LRQLDEEVDAEFVKMRIMAIWEADEEMRSGAS
jgi:hypothetical protein